MCKQWQEVKTVISGIKISPEGKEMEGRYLWFHYRDVQLE